MDVREAHGAERREHQDADPRAEVAAVTATPNCAARNRHEGRGSRLAPARSSATAARAAA